MSKKILIILTVIALLFGGVFVACDNGEEPPVNGEEPPVNGEEPILPDDYDTRTSILIGGARPLSGPLAAIGDFGYGPIYNLWAEDVNARGGIYVEEYGRSLPVELLIYDDGSDMGTMTTLMEKLILEDEVDFILSPCSTAFVYAGGPLANQYGYIMLGTESGCTTLTDMLPELPYFFSILNYSNYNQIPTLADLFVEWGVETVALIYIADLHGVEYSHIAHQEFLRTGITVVYDRSVPPFATELTLLLKDIKALEPDAVCAFVYPPTTMSVVGQAMEVGLNPKALVLGPGGNFEFFREIFGDVVLEGVIGEGAWNEKSSPAAAEFTEMFIERWGRGTADWWGSLSYYGGLQFFEQAIIEAGTLDQSVIRDVMATSTFETVLGTTWFDCVPGGGGLLALECYAGQIGQWQSGIFEVIDNDENRTADPIYPKAPWPGQ